MAKNWHIFEDVSRSKDPQVLAEISCADDQARIGYIIEVIK